MDPLLWLLFLIPLVGGWVFVNKRLTNDLLSPFNLLLISWILPMYLRALGLSGLEQPWHPKTFLYLGMATGALVLTSVVPWFFLYRTPFLSRRKEFVATMNLLRSNGFLALLGIAWLVAFCSSIYAEFLTNPGRIPLLTAVLGSDISTAADSHRWGKETRWAVIINILFIVTPMLYLAARSEPSRLRRRIILLMALSYPLMGLLKMSRSDVFIGGLNLALAEYYWLRFTGWRLHRQFMKKLQILAVAILAIVVLYFTLALRIKAQYIFVYEELTYSHWIQLELPIQGPLRELVAQFYGYLALPFENFNRLVSTYRGGFNPGISFFRPLLSIAGQGDLADQIASRIDFNVASTAAGSNTFLSYPYAELGIWGVTLVPLIYGGVLNVLYIWFRKRPGFTSAFLYLNFVYPWTWLYFNNAFSVLTFYLNAAFVVGLTVLAFALGIDRGSFSVDRNGHRIRSGSRVTS